MPEERKQLDDRLQLLNRCDGELHLVVGDLIVATLTEKRAIRLAAGILLETKVVTDDRPTTLTELRRFLNAIRLDCLEDLPSMSDFSPLDREALEQGRAQPLQQPTAPAAPLATAAPQSQ